MSGNVRDSLRVFGATQFVRSASDYEILFCYTNISVLTRFFIGFFTKNNFFRLYLSGSCRDGEVTCVLFSSMKCFL